MNNIIDEFKERYGGEPLVVRSPGRINLIGEHTDYNQGFVLPAAIDREITIALSDNNSTQCRVYSHDLQEEVVFSIQELSQSTQTWANYIIGVLRELQINGHTISGFDAVFGGNIPLGSGLSSSAALECGMGFGFDQLWQLGLDRLSIVQFGLRAENNFVGVKCGIMDQFANMFGKEGHFLQLDCRNLQHREIKVDFNGHGLILFNSNVKHQHGSSEYNVRRRECEKGVRLIQTQFPEVESLRDCTLEMLDQIPDLRNTKIYHRCRFVIEENERVTVGCEDLLRGDLEEFGRKMYQGHQGLSKLYEVSCSELDTLVALTEDLPEVLGSRMMGGGFGGCTINLVQEDQLDHITAHVSTAYKSATGMDMTPYVIKTAHGTSLKPVAQIKE